jgi:putative flippase GtrA
MDGGLLHTAQLSVRRRSEMTERMSWHNEDGTELAGDSPKAAVRGTSRLPGVPDVQGGPGASAMAEASGELQESSLRNREAAGYSRRQSLVEFIKFGLVGVMNTGVDFLVYWLLMFTGVYYLAAQVISYAAGTLNSYVVNKLWTFKGQGGGNSSSTLANRSEFIRFVSLNAGTMLLSLLLLYEFKSGLGMHSLLAKLLVTGFTVIANYIGSKLWVFRQ